MSSIFDRVGTALKSAARGGLDSILSTPSPNSSTPAVVYTQAVAAGSGGMSAELKKYAIPAAGVAAALVLFLALRKK